MRNKSVYKIPNGKLLKISLDYNEKKNLINDIKITGDFFAYPEESIEYLEHELKDTILDFEIVNKKIKSVISSRVIEFIGINSDAIAKGIMLCVK